jgi:formylglycine-generating enzyme required for sulfatase activity
MKHKSILSVLIIFLVINASAQNFIITEGAEGEVKTAIETNVTALFAAFNDAAIKGETPEIPILIATITARPIIRNLWKEAQIVCSETKVEKKCVPRKPTGYEVSGIQMRLFTKKNENRRITIHFTDDGSISNVFFEKTQANNDSSGDEPAVSPTVKPKPTPAPSVAKPSGDDEQPKQPAPAKTETPPTDSTAAATAIKPAQITPEEKAAAMILVADSCFIKGDYVCSLTQYNSYKRTPIKNKRNVDARIDSVVKCRDIALSGARLYEAQNYERAGAEYLELLSWNPVDETAKTRWEFCIKHLEDKYIGEADSCFRHGDYKCAEENYGKYQNVNGKRTLKLADSERCRKALNIADRLYLQENYINAAPQFETVLNLNPADKKVKARYDSCVILSYVSVGDKCFDAGDYKCAEDNYEKYTATGFDIKDVSVKLKSSDECSKLLDAADYLYETKSYETAQTEYDKVIELNPKDNKAKSGSELCKKVIALSSTSPALKEIYSNLIPVAGGTFTMGCTDEQKDDCQQNEQPPVKVSINNFLMGKTEVTNAQYVEFLNTMKVDSSGMYNDNYMVHKKESYYIMRIEYVDGKWQPEKDYENNPIYCVTWYGANEYCQWAKCRLPTEAEWEYAARGGNKTQNNKYAGSNSIDEIAWYGDNSDDRTHYVGEKKPNELGLHDMSGNVYEWCLDWYDLDLPKGDNPKGPSKGDMKIIRGGDWGRNPTYCRTSFRTMSAPSSGHNFLGFRVIVSL